MKGLTNDSLLGTADANCSKLNHAIRATGKRPGNGSGNNSGKNGKGYANHSCCTHARNTNSGKNGKTGADTQATNSESFISPQNGNRAASYPTGNISGNNSGNIDQRGVL